MTIDEHAERAIATALGDYSRTFDDARFDEFAALFERGRWFMVSESGSRPVLDWINEHVVLYDGSPLTRHQIEGIEVSSGDDPSEVGFRCRIVIFQQLPGEGERLLARARFTGTFRRGDDGWWWHRHTMHSEETHDLSSHITGGVG